MNDDRWALRLAEWRPWNRRRHPGRPKQSWCDELTEMMGERWMQTARNGQSTMSVECEREAQIEFNDDVIEKMKLIGENIQEEKRKEVDQLPMTLQDEVAMMPNEMKFIVFENLYVAELINVIVTYPQFEAAAGHVLRKRKCRLECLIITTYPSKSKKRVSFSAEENAVRFMCDVLNAVTTYVDVSGSEIGLNSSCIGVAPLELSLGEPPEDPEDKIQVADICVLTKELAPFLKWFRVSERLEFYQPAQQLFDANGKPMTDGCKYLILFNWRSGGPDYIDDAMTKCILPRIHIGFGCFWSSQSFFKVLSAHANSGDAGVARIIDCDLQLPTRYNPRGYASRSIAEWTQLFDDWLKCHTAEFGPPLRPISHHLEPLINYATPGLLFRLTLH